MKNVNTPPSFVTSPGVSADLTRRHPPIIAPMHPVHSYNAPVTHQHKHRRSRNNQNRYLPSIEVFTSCPASGLTGNSRPADEVTSQELEQGLDSHIGREEVIRRRSFFPVLILIIGCY